MRFKTEILSINKKIVSTVFFWVAFFCISLYPSPVQSQCAMCRAALGGEANKVQAEAVNDGIVFLMMVPYILVAAVAYAIYRMRKNKS